MDNIIDTQKELTRIYNDRKIWVGSFLGGPLAAGYLISENFKAFNEPEKAKLTWMYTILGSILIFGVLYLMPETIKIPNQIIPIAYTSLAIGLVQYFQGKNILNHINLGGELHSWWRTIVISLIGLVITLIPILGGAYLTDTINNASITTKTYGAMKHEITFDENNILVSEVDNLADGLKTTNFFDDAETKYIYAKKDNNEYKLSISIVSGIENNNEVLESFILLRNDLQALFPNNKISFNLIVDNLDNVVKTIE